MTATFTKFGTPSLTLWPVGDLLRQLCHYKVPLVRLLRTSLKIIIN